MKALVELVLQLNLVEESLLAVVAEAEAEVPSLKEKNVGVVLDDTLLVLVEVVVQEFQLVMLAVIQTVQLQEAKHLVVQVVHKTLKVVEILVPLVVLVVLVEILLLLVVQVQMDLVLVELRVVHDTVVVVAAEDLLEQRFEEILDLP
tara:strand:+ start:36 stop:476 length:441 start_codon:yes stop_codon:yes gene_type:complete